MLFRVSELESFRQWRMDEDAELEPFLARLRGEEPPSEAMLAGTAFHKALELAKPGEFDTMEALGYQFVITADIKIALPPIRELRAYKTYGPITVTGQVDGLEGLRVDDHKTTGRFDADRYLAGFQWRFYLDIFGADIFRWNVFEHRLLRERVYEVFGFHTLEQHRYPTLERDCRALALDMAAFAAEHMPERCSKEAA